MSELRMWSYLRKQNDGLPKDMQLYMQRITDRLAQGVADVYWARNQTMTGWFEMKYVSKLGKRLDLRADQALWLAELAKVKVTAGVVVRHPEGWRWIPAVHSTEWVLWVQGKDWADIRRQQTWTNDDFNIPALLAAMWYL